MAMTEGFLVLWGLFVASFLAATLLPGGSEAALFGVLKLDPGLLWAALAVATIGNTLGGLTSYFIGRSIPQHRTLKGLERVRRHGAAILLLSWLPIVGDPMCVAAGLLRLNPWLSAAFIATGKFGRYLAVAFLAT
jgi:membrane protein YqaA with SNARE-associated domain